MMMMTTIMMMMTDYNVYDDDDDDDDDDNDDNDDYNDYDDDDDDDDLFLSISGIHCTHGFNRTGFLIIAYLVEKDDWRLVVFMKLRTQYRNFP